MPTPSQPTTATLDGGTDPHLHDMDSCVRDAHGDPARFAALVQVRFPYMTRDRRSDVVADYQTMQRLDRERATRAAKRLRAVRRQRWTHWAITVAAMVVLAFAH